MPVDRLFMLRQGGVPSNEIMTLAPSGLASPRFKRSLRLPILFGGLSLFVPGAVAATISPPLLDISRQCAAGRRNVTAMSECIVAESEARSEILQKWARVPDVTAERCLKVARKAKRFPYSEIAKCLSVATVEVRPPVAAAPASVGRPPTRAVAAPPAAGAPAPITPAPSQGFSPAQSLRAFGSRLFGSSK